MFAAALAVAGLQAADKEFLSYSVEWRLIHAGNVRLNWSRPSAGPGFETKLDIESVGLVSKLFKVEDVYTAHMDDRLCVERSHLKTDEGSRHRETNVVYDARRRKAFYQERDLNKRSVIAARETDIPACVYDVVGALYQFRKMHLNPGQSAQLPVSDGKKVVMARVEAQEREVLKLDSGTYKTIRYEAFLFNNVLYSRKGRLFIWLTEDDRKLPVQIRVRMPIYIGTITLLLEKSS